MASRLAVVSVVVAVFLGSCVTISASDIGHMEQPEKPSPLTTENVQAFAKATEKATVYNEHHSVFTTGELLGCDATVDAEEGSAFLVYAECSGGVKYVWGHVDILDSTVYYISPGEVQTIENTSVRDSNDGTYGGPSYTLANFNDSTQEISVRLTPLDALAQRSE